MAFDEASGASNKHIDVLIVGAGLSGIGAAYHLQERCPDKSYVILEGRESIGGTWDIFRYPGIRSDSDMHTLGYRFKPWTEAKAIADGPSILKYVTETASEAGIDKNIHFNHMVKAAEWSSETATWTVTAARKDTNETVTFTCGFLMVCSGYYSYENGYTPDFEGVDTFKGRVVHPQFWTDDIDYRDKKVVVIGSGATAVTLVPAMAEDAAHVTMLQRSPTYIVSRPAEDRVANFLRSVLPDTWAYNIVRWRNVLFQKVFYQQTRTKPEKVRERLLGMVKDELGPDYDIETHFTPKYNPWDQRLCLIPDSDLFNAIKAGDASVVTDHIDRFDETGIKLKSGEHLDADLIVTATGLDLKFIGGISVTIDGVEQNPNDWVNYKGFMYSGVPNMASVFGYTNASWTLKADLTSEYLCRLLQYMDEVDAVAATPTLMDDSVELEPWVDFSSGYIQRSLSKFPKQGKSKPWRLNQDYAADKKVFRKTPIDDGAMVFTPRSSVTSKALEAAE